MEKINKKFLKMKERMKNSNLFMKRLQLRNGKEIIFEGEKKK